MSTRIVRGYGLYEHLKEHKPAVVMAIDGDGSETKINVADVRNKHARVMTALREIAWVRCDLLDKKGGLLYRHQRNADDRDAPAGELEDLPPTRAMAEVSGLVNIMLRAQEMVLVRHQQTTAGKDDALMRIVDSAMRRLELQEQQLEHAMRLNHQLSQDLVNAQLAQLQLSAPVPVDGDGNPRPRSDAAMDALMPSILKAAFAPQQQQPKQQPTNGTKNGVKKPAREERQPPVQPPPTE